MDERVDIEQLPIPDWGLACPRCRYLLARLTDHRCPECGTRFAMRDLVQPWTRVRGPKFTGGESPLPDFGLDCERCRKPLRGSVDQACIHCGAKFAIRGRMPKGEWCSLAGRLIPPLTIEHVQWLLASTQVPHVPMRNRSLGEMLTGSAATIGELLVPSEFYFELQWLITRAAADARRARESVENERVCGGCGERNPAHFEVCWHCEADLA